MSPEVKNPQLLGIGEKPSSTLYFTVDLNSEVPFDSESFDNLAKLITYPNDGKYLEKFICFRGIMYVFPYRVYHDEFYKKMKFNKKEIECAGDMTLDGNQRILSGYSVSLRNSDILSLEKSQEYKTEFLTDKLKDFFTIK